MPSTSGIFHTGKKTGIGAAKVQLTTADILLVFGALVRADKDNTGTIEVISKDDSDGDILEPKDGIFIEIDNLNKIYVKGSAADQIARWTAV